MKNDILKIRTLEECYIVIHQVKTTINTMYDGKYCQKDAYSLFGINLHGKRQLLYYGVKLNPDSSFWLDAMQNIKSRGVKKVFYMLVNDYKDSKRAIEINFPNVKIYKSPYLLIDKTRGYLSYGYREKTQYQLRNLYLQIDIDDYNKELNIFKELHFHKIYIKIILEKELEEIANYYTIDYNIRKIIFSCNFVREYKRHFSTTHNKLDKLSTLNDIITSFYNINAERNMVMTRLQYELLVNEICKNNNLEELL